MDRFETMLKTYPQFISKEQFYKLCHISKSTAIRLFEAELVPVIDTKKKTRRYFIAREDVIYYLRDREINPKKYYSHSRWAQTYMVQKTFSKELAKRMRRKLTADWVHEPDLLSATDLERLLGYTATTVRKWIQKGDLKSLRISNVFHVPKSHALDYVCSRKFHEIQRKSIHHINIIEEIRK